MVCLKSLVFFLEKKKKKVKDLCLLALVGHRIQLPALTLEITGVSMLIAQVCSVVQAWKTNIFPW